MTLTINRSRIDTVGMAQIKRDVVSGYDAEKLNKKRTVELEEWLEREAELEQSYLETNLRL
jgi:hypothetical protein